MQTTSDKGLNVIRSFEGRALRAYQDAVGVWTIGYGNTNYDTNAVAKLGKIGRGLTITAEQAEALFVESIRKQYEPSVRKRLAPLPNCTQGTFDAGVSFHYNTGKIGPATWPTALIQGKYDLARTSILSWNKAKGKVLNGLTRRRKREWDMISKGDYGPEGSSGPLDLDTKKQLPPPASGLSTAFTNHPGLLVQGDIGDRVKEVNGYLVQLGKLPAGFAKSAVFGKETYEAVRAFQKTHVDLTVDGKVGPATFASLLRDIDMRGSAKKTTTATAAVGVIGGGLAAAGSVALNTALIAAGLVGSAGLIYLVVTHRTELVTFWNNVRGKHVP